MNLCEQHLSYPIALCHRIDKVSLKRDMTFHEPKRENSELRNRTSISSRSHNWCPIVIYKGRAYELNHGAVHITSDSMDLKQIYQRLPLYLSFESKKKSNLPQFSIFVAAGNFSHASNLRRGYDFNRR